MLEASPSEGVLMKFLWLQFCILAFESVIAGALLGFAVHDRKRFSRWHHRQEVIHEEQRLMYEAHLLLRKESMIVLDALKLEGLTREKSA